MHPESYICFMAGVVLKTGRYRTSIPKRKINRAVDAAYRKLRANEIDLERPPITIVITKRMPTPKKAAITKSTTRKGWARKPTPKKAS